MKVLKGVKTKMSSSVTIVATTERCFQSKAAALLYIAIKGSELPKTKHFSKMVLTNGVRSTRGKHV